LHSYYRAQWEGIADLQQDFSGGERGNLGRKAAKNRSAHVFWLKDWFS
jgi:hypothetical protein